MHQFYRLRNRIRTNWRREDRKFKRQLRKIPFDVPISAYELWLKKIF